MMLDGLAVDYFGVILHTCVTVGLGVLLCVLLPKTSKVLYSGVKTFFSYSGHLCGNKSAVRRME